MTNKKQKILAIVAAAFLAVAAIAMVFIYEKTQGTSSLFPNSATEVAIQQIGTESMEESLGTEDVLTTEINQSQKNQESTESTENNKSGNSSDSETSKNASSDTTSNKSSSKASKSSSESVAGIRSESGSSSSNNSSKTGSKSSNNSNKSSGKSSNSESNSQSATENKEASSNSESQKTTENTQNSSITITVKIVCDRDSYYQTYSYQVESGATLADVMLSADLVTKYSEGQFGMYVLGIDGHEVSDPDPDQYWWSLWDNGAFSDVGCSSLYVKDGGVYTWKMMQGY